MVEAAILNAPGPEEETAGRLSLSSQGRPLRLLVLVPKPAGLSPGQRFRLEQWAPHLQEAHGITLDFVPFESPGLTDVLYKPGHHVQKAARVALDFFRRAVPIIKARRYDGVIIYRELALIGPAIYERVLDWLGVPLFFDFDDAIWHPQISPMNGVLSRLHFWGKTSTVCRISDAVLAGNGYLGDYARKRNDNVYVIPTSIELDHYPVQPELETDTPFVVCWTGSTTTLINFEHARRPLERLAAQRKVVVKVICNQPPAQPIAGAENVFIPWQEAGEAEAIGASHVGIMPLPDDDYMRGKCGLKALQYMATGLPVVIAPVGMNADLVVSGENGFLASTDEEWFDSLTRLAESRELRRTIGAAGRRTIEEQFSAPLVADKVARAVRETLARTASVRRSAA